MYDVMKYLKKIKNKSVYEVTKIKIKLPPPN